MNTIFISYSWNDKIFANELDFTLRQNGFKTIVDERDLNFKADLKQFMTTVKNSDFTITLISDSYLRSKNCLYEVGKLLENNEYKRKTIQIILPSAKIFDDFEKYNYLAYWNDKIKLLNEKIKENTTIENIELINNDLKDYKEILENLPRFIHFVISEKCFNLENAKESNYRNIINYLNSNKKKS
jgi:hypothetical protein